MNIALISAYNPGHNPGMLQVELAFQHLKASLPLDTEVTRFTLQKSMYYPASFGFSEEIISEKLIDPSQLSEFDLIIFWGDFLHWDQYLKVDLTNRSYFLKEKMTREEVANYWYRCVFFVDNPELHSRTIIFGSSIYGINARSLTDVTYYRALKKLLNNARFILMRDLYSANIVKQLAPNHHESFGCDPAFLLQFSEKSKFPKEGILFSFKRSGKTKELNQLMEDFGTSLTTPVQDFDWFQCSGMEELNQKLILIRRSNFVVTDIYHLAVTAMREEIPVILFGFGSQKVERTLSDKKKEVLMTQHLLSSNFFYVERVLEGKFDSNVQQQIISEMRQRMLDTESYKIAMELLQSHVDLVRHKLLIAISSR